MFNVLLKKDKNIFDIFNNSLNLLLINSIPNILKKTYIYKQMNNTIYCQSISLFVFYFVLRFDKTLKFQ